MKTSPCPKSSEEDMIALALGELPALRRAALRRHVAHCPDCAAALSEIAATRAHVHALTPTIAPAPDALRERIWQNAPIPSAPVPAPRRRVIGRIALGLCAGAAIIAAVTLPGTIGRPTPAFAQVEQAMGEIQTVSWRSHIVQTVSLFPNGKYKIEYPKGRGVTWARLEPPIMASVDGKDRMVYTPTERYQIDYSDSGVTAYARFKCGFAVCGENGPDSGKSPREILLEKIIFPKNDTGERQWRDRGTTVRQTPWQVNKDTLDGKGVLRFDDELQFTQDILGDANIRWKIIGTKRAVWVDPETYRIIKRRTTDAFTNGKETIESIVESDGFQYNVTPPSGVFAYQPAVGTRYSFRAFPERRATEEEEKAIHAVIRRAAVAVNGQDAPAYANQWDFEYLNVPEERRAKERRLQLQRMAIPKPVRPWRITQMPVSSTRPTGIFVQETPETPFPPTQPNEFRSFVELKDAQGKRWTWMLNLRKQGGDFRIVRADFWPFPK